MLSSSLVNWSRFKMYFACVFVIISHIHGSYRHQHSIPGAWKEWTPTSQTQSQRPGKRTFSRNYLISAMGNQLVSLVGISTLMQYSKSSQDQTPSNVPFLTIKGSSTKRALCVQSMCLFVTNEKLGVCWGERAQNEEIHLAGAPGTTSKLTTCLAEHLVNPEKHELCGCIVPSFLTVLLFCEFTVMGIVKSGIGGQGICWNSSLSSFLSFYPSFSLLLLCLLMRATL